MNAEYSLGPFCNWFLPSCLDLWSSGDGQRVLCSYGARSMLCLLSVVGKKALRAHDCLTVFGTNRALLSVTRFAKVGPNAFRIPMLFVGSGDGEAAVINCFTNSVIHQKQKFDNYNLPAKKILSADWLDFDGQQVVYYSMHSIVIGWNTSSNEAKALQIGTISDTKCAISCIASTNCGINKLAIGFMNGDITVVYLSGLSVIKEQFLSGHNDDICALSFGGAKSQYQEGILASASRDGFVKVWDVFRHYNVADVKLDANKAQHKNWFALSFSAHHNSNKLEILIGSGNGEILFIDVPIKPPDSKIRIHRPVTYMKNRYPSHSSVIFCIAVDYMSSIAITSSLDHQINLWDLTQRTFIDSFTTFTHGVHDISLSAIDPSRMAIAVGDGIHVIKFDQFLNVSNLRKIPFQKTQKTKDMLGMAVVWHPDCENRLAFGTSTGDITVVDLSSTQRTPKYTNKKSNDWTKVYALVWGPSLRDSSESTLYSLHQSGQIYVHYITSNILENFNDYVKQNAKRSEMSWKNDLRHVSVGNENGTIDVFEFVGHDLHFRLRIEAFRRSILSLKWNSNNDPKLSDWLAVSSYDNHIHCYFLHHCLNLEDESTESSFLTISKPDSILKGHSDRVSSMSWSPHDSTLLVSVSYDKTALIWDVAKGDPLIRFEGHRGILYCVVWSASDKDLVFTGGEDNYLHAWRPSKQRQCLSVSQNGCSDDYWPHLEVNETEDLKCISDLLKECVNKVAFYNDIAKRSTEDNHQNGFHEEVKQEKTSKKNKSMKKKSNKESKKTLFLLSNVIENSSTKYQKIEDIEAIFEKVTGNYVSEERLERILLYGNHLDVKKFVEIESSNHLKHGNVEQKDILNLLYDIKQTVEESIRKKETNPFLVSLSMSISRNHWKQSMAILANQLTDTDLDLQTYRNYNLEMSAITMIAQNRVIEAIDLLTDHHLFREAVIVCKTRLCSEQVLQLIMTKWSEQRRLTDCEGAVKCLVAAKKFKEAAQLLDTRNDQQFGHLISLFRTFIKK